MTQLIRFLWRLLLQGNVFPIVKFRDAGIRQYTKCRISNEVEP